jgi:hypothetical protein
MNHPALSSPFLTPPPATSIAWYPEGNCYLNLAGIYNYLELPYYLSQDYENNGQPIHPTCMEMLDAYVPPLFLEKARLVGLETPEFYISNGYFEAPAIIDPINPFTLKGRVILKPGREEAIARSLTRNHTYAICCQEIPPGSRIVHFRSVLGWCVSSRYRDISRQIWELFMIPLARIRLMVDPGGRFRVSDLSPLLIETLGIRERHYLEERVQWEQ